MKEDEEEITTELSTIEKLTKQDRNATQIDFDNMNFSPDVDNAEAILDQELINAVEHTTLLAYEQNHLNTRYKGFFKKMDINEIMQWQSSLINKTLISMSSSLENFGIQLFKNLMSYMGDRKSSKPPFMHAIKHLKIALASSEEVKDEAYLQVIKQITRNPNHERCMRGWNFLGVMASTYPPSLELYHALINYLLDLTKNGDEILSKHANYIAIRLEKTFESRRKFPPSSLEIKHVEGMKPIVVEVHFLSGASTSIQVESYTTIAELKTLVMRKIQLNIIRIPYFSIYEMCYKPDCIEERYLDEFDKVCDILSIWEKETESNKKKGIDIEFKFYLKILLYYDFKPDDLDTLTMVYVQVNFDAIKGRYNLTQEDIIKLGAIQLYIDYGTLSKEEISNNLKEHIKRYIPTNKFKVNSAEEWEEKILNEYNNLEFDSQLKAKNEYLNIIKDNELYKSSQFICTYTSEQNTAYNNSQNEANPYHITEQCVVAIKPDEIIITDLNRNKIYSMPLKSLASWGVNSETFILVEKKSEEEFSKSYFNCNQTKLFKIIIDAYTSILAGKNMVEIVTERKETCNLFQSLPVTKLKPGETLRKKQTTIYDITD